MRRFPAKFSFGIGSMAALLLGMLTIQPVLAADISWQVVHPFRYFKQPSDLWLQQKAFEELNRQNPLAAKYAPISHLERKLNNPRWWSSRDQVLEELRQLRIEEGRSPELDIRLGWGSFLTGSAPEARGEIDQICWDDSTQRHSACDQSELHGTTSSDFVERTAGTRNYRIPKGRYIYPKFHRIMLEVRDPPDGAEICSWNASTEIFLSPDDGFRRERLNIEAPCEEGVPARVRFVPEGETGERGVDVTVEILRSGPNNDVVASASERVEVRDILIFALGDSYSSGEGNPEIPAKLHPTRAIGRAQPSGVTLPNDPDKYFGIPRRSPAGSGSAAIWTDRRCHRSVYSYQTRVALQIAIAPDENGNHHHAVTYLQFTCSGAEVPEDILYAWEGRECLSAAMRRRRGGPYHAFYMPQFSKAAIELCPQLANPVSGQFEHRRYSELAGLRWSSDDHYFSERNHLAGESTNVRPFCGFRRYGSLGRNPSLWYCWPQARARPVDLVLSTVGGNDVGFSKVVAKAVINNEHKFLQLVDRLPFIGEAVDRALFVDKEEAKERIGRLPQRLEMYNQSLETFLGVKASASAGQPVIVMAYPNLIYQKNSDDADRFCPGGNETTDVSEFLSLNGGFLPDVEAIIEDPCDGAGNNCGLIAAIRKKAEDFNWRFVDSHRDLFRSHGICATDPNGPDESGKGSAEVPGIPFKLVDLTRTGTNNQYGDDWRRYDPVTDYFPYESRKSGFRSPVQDFMNIQYFKERMPDDWEEEEKASAIFLAKRILGGSFHPTAEAHSHIADHVYCEAREQLFGEECLPKKVLRYAHPW